MHADILARWRAGPLPASSQADSVDLILGDYAQVENPQGSPKWSPSLEKHFSGDYLTVYRWTDSGRWLIVEQVWTEATGK